LGKKKVKWSRYRPGMAHRLGRGIALLVHDRGTRRGWLVSSTPRPHFTPGKDLVPILQEAKWAPGPVWTGSENLAPHRDSIPDRPARSRSLYRLSYYLTKNPNRKAMTSYRTFDLRGHSKLPTVIFIHCCFTTRVGTRRQALFVLHGQALLLHSSCRKWRTEAHDSDNSCSRDLMWGI